MSDGRNLKAHLFVCTNQKEKGQSCAPKGAQKLRDQVKTICQDPSKNWHGKIRVNQSGCLGRCEEGITAVLYPQAKWFTELTAESGAPVLEQAIKEALEG